MKKSIYSIMALAAMCMASCEGYNDKQLEEAVPYGPTKSAELQVGQTIDLRKEYSYTGAWTTDSTHVATVNSEGVVTAVAPGEAWMDATSVSNLYFHVTVLEPAE